MKVLFIDSVHEVLAQRLKTHDFECIDASNLTKEECIDQLEDTEGIVIRSRFPMDEAFLKHAPNLKFIARSGAGMENIDLSYTEQHNIRCFNAPEGNRNAVGEHALGMLLALFNRLIKGDKEVRQGIWDREGNRGVELEGKTVAIIGYGNNGKAFAKKLSGFDVNVLTYDKYLSDYSDEYAKETDWATIFNEADVISFHIPQTEETKFIVNTDFLTKFKKSIYLINLSRGKIVKTAALVNALESKKVLGACLDVLEYESTSFENAFHNQNTPDLEYLLKSEKVILSPHVGGWTKESYFKLSNVLANKILAEFS
jgi:D-3-phosphoglycerate dehydrogenase / 2-oxoglutarate reductase